MAIMTLMAAFVTLTGPGDISNRCSKIELATDVEEKDVTTFASLGWKEVLGGLKSGSLGLSLKNDLVDDGLDEDLWAVNGTVIAFTVRASNAVVGTSNPNYTGNVLIKGLKPINGAVGDVNEQDLSFPTSGAITRAVA